MSKLNFRPLQFDDISKYEAFFARHAPQNRWYNLRHLYIMRHRHHTQIAFGEHGIYLMSKIEGEKYFHQPIFEDKRREVVCHKELSQYAKKHKLASTYLNF